MKAIITLTAGLMILSTTFAQSRRTETKENNESNSRRTEAVSTERRSSADRTNNTTTNTQDASNRRGTTTQQQATTERKPEVNNQEPRRGTSTQSATTERKPEVSTRTQEPQTPPANSRTESYSNRRGNENASSERRADGSTGNNPGNQGNTSNQDRTSATGRRYSSDQQQQNRNNGYGNNNNNQTREYESVRRQPASNQQVVVQQQSRRPVQQRYTVVNQNYHPVPVEVRRVQYPYRVPVRGEIIWTVDLSRRYDVYYPEYRIRRYHEGMRLATIPAYDAFDFVGEIARVYGRVTETNYSWETDEYFLYLGDYYPYQDFTVIVPGPEARDFSRRPERFFSRENIEVTGLITRYDGKPEMIIKRSNQIGIY